ncbi:MAG: DUF3857 and transglutaminase domain-containing protein [Candidatus Zixiibacteriota bacterium]
MLIPSLPDLKANLLPIFLLLALCFSSWGSTRLLAWEKIDFRETPAQENFPYSDAVIIKDEAVMEIETDGEALFTHHRIMKIFSDPDKRYSRQEIPFNRSVSFVKIKARTIHPDGEEFPLDAQDVREKSLFSDYVLYSDSKVKEFYIPRVSRDCVVEYEYQLRFSSLLYWADWFFQSYLPTLHSKYTLAIPRHFDFNVRVLNDKIVPKVDFRRGKKVFVWETFNKEAIRKEVFMPPAADLASRLAFSPIEFKFDGKTYPSASWNDIARWYRDISHAGNVLTQELNLLALELTSGLDSRKEKTKELFDYVQEHVRYVSVAIGSDAFKPHACADVLEYGYGDCKDMTSLLVALLKAVGIEAFPALLSTKGHRSVLTDMPKVKQFDHVVTAVPLDGRYIWLDPACRNCRFGELPFEDQGAAALVVKPDGGKLILTPETGEDTNVTRTLWDVKLNSDGSASAEVIIQAAGQEGLAFRASLTELKPQRRRKALSGFLSSWFSDPYLLETEFRNFEEKDSSIFVHASVDAGSFGVKQGERLFLPMNLNTQDYLNLMFPHAQRRFPVIFDYRFVNTDELTVSVPQVFEIEYLPGPVRLDESFGLFESTYELEGDKILHKRLFVRKELLVPVTDYDRLKDFYEQAAAADNQRIILKRIPPTDEADK